MEAHLSRSSAKIRGLELMTRFTSYPRLLLAAGALTLCAFLLAQGEKPTTKAVVPPDPSIGEINMTTHIGSFKLLDGVGRVEMNFTGTMLVSQLKGTV